MFHLLENCVQSRRCPSYCSCMGCSRWLVGPRASLARTLEWVSMPFSRGSFRPRGRTWASCTAGGFSGFSTSPPALQVDSLDSSPALLHCRWILWILHQLSLQRSPSMKLRIIFIMVWVCSFFWKKYQRVGTHDVSQRRWQQCVFSGGRCLLSHHPSSSEGRYRAPFTRCYLLVSVYICVCNAQTKWSLYSLLDLQLWFFDGIFFFFGGGGGHISMTSYTSRPQLVYITPSLKPLSLSLGTSLSKRKCVRRLWVFYWD